MIIIKALVLQLLSSLLFVYYCHFYNLSRVIIPKNIGYDKFGMGPVPTEPGDRRKLGKLLDLLEVDKGELIFDLELLMVADDENDQGDIIVTKTAIVMNII